MCDGDQFVELNCGFTTLSLNMGCLKHLNADWTYASGKFVVIERELDHRDTFHDIVMVAKQQCRANM